MSQQDREKNICREEHFQDEIHEDPFSISDAAHIHIKKCSVCRAEYEIMREIISGLSELPDKPVPSILKEEVMQRISKPAYHVWQTIAAVFLLMLSPFLIRFLLLSEPVLYLNKFVYICLCIFFGMSATLLLIPLCMQIYQEHRKWVDKMHRACDNLFE